jgi:hypothetical protein
MIWTYAVKLWGKFWITNLPKLELQYFEVPVSCYVQLLFFLFQKCTVTNSFPKIVFKEIYQNWNSNILKHKSSVVHPLFFLFLKCTDTKYFPKLLKSNCSMPQLLLGTIVLKKTIDLSLQGDLPTSELIFFYIQGFYVIAIVPKMYG